jgi:uncharacterized protein
VTLAPTPSEQRIESIDVLRGLALFGVLLENLQHFVSPSYAVIAAAPDAGWLDRGGLWIVRFCCDNKVYLLFSFLFGYGIALQMIRTAAENARFVPLHLWRMAVLFLIGFAHSMIWRGDILSTYAILGVLLLPLRRAGRQVLLGACAIGLLAPLIGLSALALLAPDSAQARESLQTTVFLHVYPLRQTAFAFGMFALGLLAGRRGVLTDPAAFAAGTRRLLPAAAALGAAANLASVILMERLDQGTLSAGGVLLEASIALGTPSLAFCYVHALLWSLTRPRIRTRLQPLASVGRTTLTNYLIQSAIGVGILARTGLGPLGPITPPAGIALTVVIFGLQVAASRWWLRRFRFGPVEWLWRSASYGEIQPFRRQPS